MPTNEEAPWARDARRRVQELDRPAAYASSYRSSYGSNMWLVWAVLGILALFFLVRIGATAVNPPVQDTVLPPPPTDPGSPAPKAMPPRPNLQLRALKSRFVSPTLLEVRGRGDIEGMWYRLRGSAGRTRVVLGDVRTVNGRFRVAVGIPHALQGRKLRITARPRLGR